jgi:hypothetical protein
MESELPDAFAPRSEEERQDAFVASTLGIILGQLGYSKAEIEGFRRDVGDPGLWNFDWLNAQGWLPLRVAAERVFTFDLAEAFFRPTKSRLLQAYQAQRRLHPQDDSFVLVFKVTGWGRMIAATPPLLHAQTHINAVINGDAVRIAPLGDFFTAWRDR